MVSLSRVVRSDDVCKGGCAGWVGVCKVGCMNTTTAQTMTVSVPLSVTVDPEDWTLNYGVEGTSAIRADVKLHVANLVRDALYGAGIESVEVKVK